MIEILHVTDCYRGGVRTHLDLLAKTLRECRHTLILLGDRNDIPSPAFAQAYHVRFARKRPWTWRAAAQQVKARWRPGVVVHAHSTFGAWVAGLASLPVRAVYTPHAHFTMIPTRGLRSLGKAVLVRWERFLFRHGVHLVACGAEEQEFLRRALPGEPPELIPHGFDLQLQSSAGRDIDYLFVGRLDWQKNPEAFIHYLATHPGRAIVAGQGPLMEDCKDLAQRKGIDVEFLGYVDEVLPLMQRSKAFVLSSRYEVGTPYVVLEALSAGCKVVVVGQGPGMAEIANQRILPLRKSLEPLLSLYRRAAGEGARR